MTRTARILAGAAVAVAAVGGNAHASGMPQLDFGNPLLLSQVVWGAFIFAAFYWGVSRIGLPRVDAILAMRADVIGGDLEQARLSKQRADQAVAELNEARRTAYAKSQAEVSAALQKAKDDAAAQAAESGARLDRQLAESEAQIAGARDRAMASLRDIAVDTAGTVIERLTHRHPDHRRVQDAVDRDLRSRGLAA